MSKFLTGKPLNDCIYGIIWEAKEQLLIVSPYIRLDDYFIKLLEKHENNYKLQITIIFGKNENDISRSLKKSDFDFFSKFPNISVIYCSKLHGKYYGNELNGVITSINLHDHSFENNIEFGVETKQGNFNMNRKIDLDAWKYSYEIANEGIPVLINRPVYEKKWHSMITGKSYIRFSTLLDQSTCFYGYEGRKPDENKKRADFPEYIDSIPKNSPMPEKHAEKKESNSVYTESKKQTGYCIRTGIEITYNPKKPLSHDAWKEWAEYENIDYKESYCHKTGKKSLGKTSFRKPMLNDDFENKVYKSNVLRWD